MKENPVVYNSIMFCFDVKTYPLFAVIYIEVRFDVKTYPLFAAIYIELRPKKIITLFPVERPGEI